MSFLSRRSQIQISVAVFILLAISAFFMARVEMPAWSPVVSAVTIVVFALPSIWAAKMWLGNRDTVILFASLGFLALLIEIAAITTGVPYGHFGYSNHLGYLIFGVVPWTVSFAWPPLLLGAYALAAQIAATAHFRILVTPLVLLSFDLVLDPGAVFLGFWSYADGGAFYGVPLVNFAGWLVTGLAGATVLEILRSLIRPLLPVPIQLISSAFLIVFFWTLLAAFAGMWIPAVIGVVLLIGMGLMWRKFHFAFDDRVVLVDENNNPVGTACKLAVHGSDTPLHRAFSVFIFNTRGELLLQQRAFSKKTWPGVWSNSCCGHVKLHESTEKAAARRLRLELGLKRIQLDTVLPGFRYRAEKDGIVENEICPVLVGMTDDLPAPNPAEVADVRWMDWDAFLKSLDQPERELSPWGIQEARLLAESEIFCRWFASRSPGRSEACANLAANNLNQQQVSQ